MTASERAAGELVADVDTLAAAIRRALDAGGFLVTQRDLAEALVAAGFGRIDAARREIAEAERRGAERVVAAVEAVPSKRFSALSADWVSAYDVRHAARESARSESTS